MISMRTCIFHPKRVVQHWSGHIHLQALPQVRIIVGLCKECVSTDVALNDNSSCAGCYGLGVAH